MRDLLVCNGVENESKCPSVDEVLRTLSTISGVSWEVKSVISVVASFLDTLENDDERLVADSFSTKCITSVGLD